MVTDLETHNNFQLVDTGERIIPPREGEVSLIFARHKLAYQFASRYVEGKEVLDIGCGTGYGSSLLAEKAKHVYSLDYSPSAIEYAMRTLDRNNLNYIVADATHIPFNNELFDVIISMQVIEHLDSQEEFLEEIRRALKRDGYFILSTPNVPESRESNNIFHQREFTFFEFDRFLGRYFGSIRIYGVNFRKKHPLREFIQGSPLYNLGRKLSRGSPIKKIATRTLKLTDLEVTDQAVQKAMDLIGVCRK